MLVFRKMLHTYEMDDPYAGKPHRSFSSNSWIVYELIKFRVVMKAFIFSQFVYCRLVWVFQSRQLTNVIKNIQEQALK